MIVLSYQYITSQNNGNYFIKNANVNDSNANFGTAFYGGDIAFYASSRSKSGGDLEFHYGFIDEYGDIIDSKVLGRKVNSKYDEVDMVFSRDYKTVYFTRRSDGGHMELFKAKVSKAGAWSKITRLPFNRSNISIGHPALSNSDKVLYFSSDMPGSKGGFDIFKVRILSENTYGKPKRLGSKVNTEGNETTPFILGSTLYFSSDGRGGLGGLDIFLINLANEYSTAKNIGKPINSAQDDYGYVQSRSIGLGYFTSSRTSGKGGDDIYSFQKLDDEIPDAAQNDVVAKTDEVTIIPEKGEIKPVISKKEENTKRARALKAERINKKRREKKKRELEETAKKKAAEEKAIAAKKVIAAKKAAEEKAVAAKKVIADKKAAEEKAVAAKKVIADKKAAEEKAVAAKKVIADKKAAEEKAVAAKKVIADKKAAEEKAIAAKKVIAAKKAAEEKAVAAKKVIADKKAAEEKAIAAKKVIAAKKAAEEKAVAAKKVIAAKKAAEEKAVAVVEKTIVEETPKPKQKNVLKKKPRYITAYELCQFQFDNLNSVYFDFKKSYVNAKIANEVDKLIRIMKRCPNIVAIVSSHTDSRSSAAFNIKLSQRRSDAIVNYILRNSNLTTRRVKSVGYGETKLRNKCTDGVWCSEAEHKVNRRTQFESRNY